MKRTLIVIPLLALVLTGCGVTAGSSSAGESSSSLAPSSSSDVSSSSSESELAGIKSIYVVDEKNAYPLGYAYETASADTLIVTGVKTGGSVVIPKKTASTDGYTISPFGKGPDGASFSPSTEFSVTGSYTFTVKYLSFTASVTVKVNSKTEYDGYYKLNNDYPINQDRDSVSYSNAFGDMKVLVLPIAWSDQTNRATAANYDMIDKTFNGTVEDTKWNSLHSYFETASFGQFHVSAYVADWYTSVYDYASVLAGTATPSVVMLAAINELYNKNAALADDDINKLDWSTFDSDSNNYFDCVMFVNTGARKHTSQGGSQGTWGWQTEVARSTPGTGMPDMKNVVWFNIDFLTSLTDYVRIPDGGINSRVAIHEFGHSLGLADYYNYGDSNYDTIGRLDMQDYNCFDWNVFSKFTVGWLDPYVIDGTKAETEITIEPSADTGDCIVVARPNAFMDTPFCEYLIIDLYTPTGNNAYDAGVLDASYGTNTSGVRIYHVNAAISTSGNYVYDDDEGKTTNLLELVQAGGQNTFMTSNSTTRDKYDLFQAGDDFTTAEFTQFFPNGVMDDKMDLGYKIDIVSSSDESATIRFTLL